MKKILLIVIAILLSILTLNHSFGGEEHSVIDIDGNVWREFSKTQKTAYLTGFSAGSEYVVDETQSGSWPKGLASSIASSVEKDIKDAEGTFRKLKDMKDEALKNNFKMSQEKVFSYMDYLIISTQEIVEHNKRLNRFLLDGRVSQFADGLDALYEDFKNRNIKTADAIYVVQKQISGTSKEDIERILLYLRGGKTDINIFININGGFP